MSSDSLPPSSVPFSSGPSAAAPDNWFHRMHAGQVPPPPVATLLGATIRRVDVAAGELDVDYVAQPAFANPAGAVQGGMLGAMLDDLCAGLVDSTLAAGEVVATLNLNTSYLRPARIGELQGRARIKRRGRQIVYVEAELMQGGQAVVSAVATCMIAPAPVKKG